MWFEPKSGQTRHNAEQKKEVVKYAEKHGSSTAKHYDTIESNIRYVYVNWYWRRGLR